MKRITSGSPTMPVITRWLESPSAAHSYQNLDLVTIRVGHVGVGAARTEFAPPEQLALGAAVSPAFRYNAWSRFDSSAYVSAIEPRITVHPETDERWWSYNDLVRRNGSGLCRDATMLSDDLVGLIVPTLSNVGAHSRALCTATKKPSDDRTQALKIPAPRKGRNLTLTENTASPYHVPQKASYDHICSFSAAC